MINKIFDMTVQGSMGAPTLTTYLLDTPEGLLIRERPIVLICPAVYGNGFSCGGTELLGLAGSLSHAAFRACEGRGSAA